MDLRGSRARFQQAGTTALAWGPWPGLGNLAGGYACERERGRRRPREGRQLGSPPSASVLWPPQHAFDATGPYMPLRREMLWIAKREGRRWMRKVVTKSTVPPPSSSEPPFLNNTRIPSPEFPRHASRPSVWLALHYRRCQRSGLRREKATRRDPSSKAENANQTTLRQSPAFLRVNTWIIVKQVARARLASIHITSPDIFAQVKTGVSGA